jgi:hypothetical protein
MTTMMMHPKLTHLCYCYYYYLPFYTGGPPLGYFDWNMITQIGWYGIESIVLFGAIAWAMDVAFTKQWIDQFE